MKELLAIIDKLSAAPPDQREGEVEIDGKRWRVGECVDYLAAHGPGHRLVCLVPAHPETPAPEEESG